MSSTATTPRVHVPILDEVSLLPVVRALIECGNEVERVSARHIEGMGLTPAQFDVLSVLGDTEGKTCKDLGAHTMITKGTLLPVLDRLEKKGLVRRCKGTQDARQTWVHLTDEGQALYEATFMPHVEHMRPFTEALKPKEQEQLIALLGKLRASFASAQPKR